MKLLLLVLILTLLHHNNSHLNYLMVNLIGDYSFVANEIQNK